MKEILGFADDRMLNVILLSIRPEYARLIYDGRKRFEYRKVVPRYVGTGDVVLLYETAPVQKITGYFIPLCVYRNIEIMRLWEISWQVAGITLKNYQSYFKGKSRVNAFEIGEFREFREPANLEEVGIIHPPQNFCYVKRI